MQRTRHRKLKTPPLFVDLDHSLLRIDCLFESIGLLLRRNPLKLFPLLLMLFRGSKPALKKWLAEEVTLETATLPYRESVLELIEERKKRGAKVYLATGSNKVVANQIVEHLGCFDGVLASDETTNLIGEAKLDAIKTKAAASGSSEFDYVGDSRADLPIFAEARKAYIIQRSKQIVEKAKTECTYVAILDEDRPWVFYFIKQLRPHQWTKNCLLFLPLIMARSGYELIEFWNAALCFVFWSFTASAVYFINDWVDVLKDRNHPSKKRRPLACGGLPLAFAPFCGIGLALLGLIGSLLFLPQTFALVLLAYLVANLLYSFWFKTKAMLDVVALTLMYVIRVYAGGVATGIEVSDWLLSLCLFFFLSLALAKRFSELYLANKLGRPSDYRIRGYEISDTNILAIFGIASAIASICVIAMYIQEMDFISPEDPVKGLWLLCPLILYWLGRFWIITYRGDLDDDPIVFALKDKISYVILVCVLMVFLIS